MKTLIYCTSYGSTNDEWQKRYRRWLDGIKRLGLADQILIVDDGSPVLPGWSDLLICSVNDPAHAYTSSDGAMAVLNHHTVRLGRYADFNFPGWYRSFRFGPAYALAHGFERIIHIESDCFVLSDKLRAFFDGFTSGWTALWTERYQFPELALQIAAGPGLRDMYNFTQLPYDHLRYRLHETAFPFHQVEQGFVGDRSGESFDLIPQNADFVCQVTAQREASYYWWLPEGAIYDQQSAQFPLLELDFTISGNSADIIGEGWSGPENEFRWMEGARSSLNLPALPGGSDLALRLHIHPFLHGVYAPRQRLWLIFNGTPVAEFELTGTTLIGTMLPAHLINHSGPNRLEFLHPLTVTPSIVAPESGDTRTLSFALTSLTLAAAHERQTRMPM